MIEERAITSRDLKFEGGLKIPQGAIIYICDSEEGKLASYYPDSTKSSVHCFAIAEGDYSVLTRPGTTITNLILLPDDPEPAQTKEREATVLRLRAKIEEYRREAFVLQSVLKQLGEE